MPALELFVILLACTAVPLGIGAGMLRLLGNPFGRPGALEGVGARLSLSVATGLGVIASAIAFVGLLIGWRPWLWVLIAVFVLASAGGWFIAWRDVMAAISTARRWLGEAGWGERVLVGLAVVTLLQITLLIGFPVHTGTSKGNDDARTYLKNPQVMLHTGRLAVVPADHFTVYPMNRGMLSVLGYQVEGERTARMFSLVFGWALMGFTAALAMALVPGAGRRAAALAVPLILCQGELIRGYGLLICGKDDLPAVVFSLAAMFVLAGMADDRRRFRQVALAGFLFAVAVNTKPSAVFYAPVLALFALRWLRQGEARTSRKVWQGMLAAALAGFSVGYLPWLLRSWIEFGNPLHPFISDVYAADHAAKGLATYPLAERLWNGLLSPVLLTFGQPHTSEPLAYHVWVLAAVGAFAPAARGARGWMLGIITLVFAQPLVDPFLLRTRYMLPAAAILAVLAGTGLVWMLSAERRWIRWGLGVPAAIWAGFTVLPRAVGFTGVSVLLGLLPAAPYNARFVAEHEPAAWAQEHMTMEDRAWFINVLPLYFPAERVNGEIIASMFERPTTEERCACLDSAGVDYVVTRSVSRDGIAAFAATCLDTVFVSSDSVWAIYRVQPPSPR